MPRRIRNAWSKLTLRSSAVCFLAATRIALHVLPFRVINRYVQGRTVVLPADQISAGAADGMIARRLADERYVCWAVERAASALPGLSTCLAKAVAVVLMLANRGWPASLRIGVANRDGAGNFEAHAWVEGHSGIVIGEVTNMGRFSVFQFLDPTVGNAVVR
ncbi:MAG: lasso peptide biosynthesis B2 protein [Capsulimonadaceae bacterium]